MNKNYIKLNKYCQVGKLQNSYAALRNVLKDDVLSEFNTDKINYDFTNPIEMECQQSYDDSINLILNNNSESPKIINTRFAKLENNTYEYVIRNQNAPTNLYNADTINQDTDLFLRSFIWPKIDLQSIENGGQLMGGNYIFYIKYMDEDGNESDVMSESGVVSIFHGQTCESIHGALSDERTSKSIVLKITNLDTSYSYFSLYCIRETSDSLGFNMTKAYKINQYAIEPTVTITINGYEPIIEIAIESLNIKYNYYNKAKTQAIVQNMLFLGNVKSAVYNSAKLQQLSYYIEVVMKKKLTSIGYISPDYSTDYYNRSEYYDPKNLYYYVGYWPDEYYKLGVVYLLNDGTTTPVFSLRGRSIELDNYPYIEEFDEERILDVNTLIKSGIYLDNTGGVFKTPNIDIIDHKLQEIKPLYFQITIPSIIQEKLSEQGVIGYFFVRTVRTPTNLFQGLSVGVDANSGFIAPYITNNAASAYYIESFINNKGTLTKTLSDRLNVVNNVQYSALLSLDPMVVPQLQSMLLWSDYKLKQVYNCYFNRGTKDRHFICSNYYDKNNNIKTKLVFVEKNTPAFYIGDKFFSTKAGNEYSVKDFYFINEDNVKSATTNLVRGITCPIIGTNDLLDKAGLYTVQIERTDEEAWVTSLLNNNNAFFAISDRYRINENIAILNIYRGDCFTNTVTIRINRNFVDPSIPTNDLILDPETWSKNYKGLSTTPEFPEDDDKKGKAWTNINLGDINAVPLGIWVTFKCLSNYNLGLRAINRQDLTSIEQLGTYGSFYPINKMSTKSTNKTPESQLLNSGYSKSLGKKYYTQWIPSPYENFHHENRIAFSNVASTKMFTNGFRIFNGLSYQDVDKQFGAIVKLFPYNQNLLCVFEHGLAIIPINEKALLSTQEGLSIHLYGAGVLQEQVSVISPDYGSTWMDSIIKTPDAFYGVDSVAKKIWKYNNLEGFVCISDFKIQSYLNEIIDYNLDTYFAGATNIKTHFNKFKNDVIFTFYKNNIAYSLCYNEVLKKWISRQTWIPMLSANIDNDYYSFDYKESEYINNIYKQTLNKLGVQCAQPFYSSKGIDILYDDTLFTSADVSLELQYDDILTKDLAKISKNENGFKLFLDESLFEEDDPIVKVTFIVKKINGEIITNNSNRSLIIGKYKDVQFYLYKHDINAGQDFVSKWYDKEHPFELEFIVNQPASIQKIYNNLVIISNNVEPESLEIEIIGDVYDFPKDTMNGYDFPIINLSENKQYFTKINKNNITKEYSLLMHQDCLNIKDFGRRLGNISYDEGKWHCVLQPIYYNQLKENIKILKNTRLRDKWAKIRIKYSGERLAIITAIQTLYQISYG